MAMSIQMVAFLRIMLIKSMRSRHGTLSLLLWPVQAVARFEELVRIERLLLETGSGTETDYLDAEADLLVARANLVEARHGEIAARGELSGAIGQLSLAWLTQTVEDQP